VILLLLLQAGCYAAMMGGMIGMGGAMTFTGLRGKKACDAERQAVTRYLDRLQAPDSLAAIVPEYRIRLEALLMHCRPRAGTDSLAGALRRDVDRLATLRSDRLPDFMTEHLPRVREFLNKRDLAR
jgi:hypothetical protein